MQGMLSVKIAVAKFLTARLIGELVAVAYRNNIPFRGLRFSTADPQTHPGIKASLFWGFYESAEIRFVNAYLPRHFDVIELGSSIGVVSCFIRKRIAPERKLICVEAHPRLTKQWMVNLRLNQLGKSVFLVNKAISYCQEPRTKAPFVAGMKNTGGRVGRAEDDGEEMLVECVRLSDIIAEHIEHDFSLVCDIEGSEVELLYHEPEALNRCRFAIMELHKSVLHGKEIGVDETLRRMTSELGFKLIDRNGPVVCLESKRNWPRASVQRTHEAAASKS